MEFVRQIIRDLKMNFDEVRLDGEYRVYVAKGETNVSVPLRPMYQEYRMVGYQQNLKNYIEIIDGILNSYQFKLNLNNVFPIIKEKSFKIDVHEDFLHEDLFCNLVLYWVTDMGEVFRFVSTNDLNNAGIDINTLKIRSFDNLNKITNPLVKLDNSMDIYTLRFDTDYAATLFLSKHIQKQIKQKIGNDILFCMPSAVSLLCAKYNQSTFTTYTHILQQLIMTDNDVNKISDRIYRRDGNGKYSIIA